MTKKILIADDDKSDVNYLIKAFEERNYSVQYVDCASAAEEIILNDKSIDAIVLDGVMPNVPGGRADERLPAGVIVLRKMLDAGITTPAILHSTYLSQDLQEVLGEWGYPYFNKSAEDVEGIIKHFESKWDVNPDYLK